MSPQDACSLATRLGELFTTFSPADREPVRTTLEKLPFGMAKAVIWRYAQESATFDRGKLRTLLWEEYSRRSRGASPTAQWKDARQAESNAIDERLNSIPKSQLHALVDDLRKKRPEVFRFLKSDPLQTDIGKSLIHSELKHTQDK